MNRIILAALLAAGVALSAQAQTYQDSGGTVVPGVVPIQPGVGPLFTSANPGKISGSFSASLSGFQPTPSYASLSVGAASSRVALPSGTVVVVYNTGTNAAYVTIGGASVTATASNDFVPAGGWMAFAVGSSTYLAGIETAGTTTLNLSGGSGLPTGACCAAGAAGGGSNASVGSTGSAVPASATLGGMSVGGTMTAVPGTSNGLKIDGSAVTQPVSAASLPLPTGAATAAGQSTVAGSGSTTSGQTGNLDMAAVTSSSPAYTNGQTNPLSLTTVGALRVDGSAVTQPVSAASLPLPSGAATATNQTNVQSAAGTPDATAITIQGNASGVPVPVTGTLSASVGGFTPTPSYAQLSVTGTSSRVALPTGTAVIVYNTGSNPAYVILGNSSVTATANDDVIQPNSWTEFTVGSNAFIAGIETAGATSLTISGGAGLATGAIASVPFNPSVGATGSSVPASGALVGVRAQNAEASPTSNGNLTAVAAGLEGKLINLPFANKENMVRGTASQAGTSATTLIAAQGSGVKIYVTGVQCKNSGSTTTIVALNDTETSGSGTVLIVPTAGGDNEVYQTPLVVAANTALTFTPSAASSTIFCNAQGYTGS